MPRPGGGHGDGQMEGSCSTSAKCRKSEGGEVKDRQSETDGGRRTRLRRRSRAVRSVPVQMADWSTGARVHHACRLQGKRSGTARHGAAAALLLRTDTSASAADSAAKDVLCQSRHPINTPSRFLNSAHTCTTQMYYPCGTIQSFTTTMSHLIRK